MGWQQCLGLIRKTAGVDFTDEDLAAILGTILDRKRRTTGARLSEPEAFAAVAAELSAEAKQAAAIARRNAVENLKKRVARRAFYDSAPAVRNPITGRTTPQAVMGLEAKLAGINSPMNRGRLSVDAQQRALARDYVVGMGTELDKAGLTASFRKGTLDRDWTRELAELNKTDGKPGITGNIAARQIAEIVHKYQKLAVDDVNRAGAWVGDYDGYVSRQSHDPDRIRRAGYDQWRAAIADKLDPKTFDGIDDPERFLRSVHDALVTGVHMTVDGMQGFKDPAFTGPGNMAARYSQSRVLHFKDAESWLFYHQQFGRGTLADSVMRQFTMSAKATALLREFGTNPRAEFDGDLRYLQERARQAGDTETALKVKNRAKHLGDIFDELDGTSATPVNRTMANIGRAVRAYNSLTKLGSVFFAGITDLPFKAAELKYQGVGLFERYWNNIASLAHGFRSDEVRDLYDTLRAGHDGMWGHLASRFDASDTWPGTMAKLQNRFMTLTGHAYWVDAQRAGAERLMSRMLGRQKELGYDALAPESRRMLGLFGIDTDRWDMLRSADWKMADGATYLTPDAVDRIKDVRLERYLRATGALGDKAPPDTVAGKIAGLRRELQLQLLSYFGDRSDYAIFTPGARERALLRLGTKPGTIEGEALRLIAQFKTWSVTAITKSLGREVYGNPGKSTIAKVAGVAMLSLEATLTGWLAHALKDAAKGRTPRDPFDTAREVGKDGLPHGVPMMAKVWADAFAYGGGLGIYGDFIMGEYGRDRSLLGAMMGPTFGQLDDVADLWNRARNGDDVAASALRFGLNNAPFINLFYTRAALDYLILYQVQEALNPGFLRRYERSVQQKTHQRFFISPAAHVPYGGGFR
jgi:hypothetical protein